MVGLIRCTVDWWLMVCMYCSSTIELEGHLIHIGYVQFDKELLLLAFPAERLVRRNNGGGKRERERESLNVQ